MYHGIQPSEIALLDRSDVLLFMSLAKAMKENESEMMAYKLAKVLYG